MPDRAPSNTEQDGAAAELTLGAEVVCQHIAKSYGELIPALRDVSFRAAPGEMVLLRGASGSGKSTILNLVAGLDLPDRGRVLVDGVPVTEIADPARYRREVVGFVFQLHHLLLEFTAEENVEVPLMPTRMRRRDRLARARAALAEVGLESRGAHLPAQLSGGERQRVAIARAIVGRPRLLLADEPTGSLDSQSSARTLELLADLCRERAMTVLLVSYEPAAARYADRVLDLRDGTIVGDTPTRAPRPGATA